LPLIPLILLGLPLIEIAGFVIVGDAIGVLPTIGLVILTGIAGSLLLRVQGFGVMKRINAEMQAGRDPSRELAHGVMVLVAGVLLLLPGFVTDIVGILLFIPPIRDLGWKFLRKRIRFAGGFTTSGFRRQPGGPTLDLDADEYSSDAKSSPPPPRIDRR
jgi:UPF0716 protein FxsA